MKKLQLRLYVAGQSPNSVAAVRTFDALCAALPAGSFEAQVLDVLSHPAVALEHGVFVTPMLELVQAGGTVRRVAGAFEQAQVQNLLL